MKPRSRIAAACGAVLLSGCLSEFPSESPPRYIAEAADWPDTLTVTSADTLRIALRDPTGRLLGGLTVQWSSSDSQVLAVTPLPLPHQPGATLDDTLNALRAAIVRANARGWAHLTVTVGAEPFDTVLLRDSIRVLERWVTVTAGDEFACALTIGAEAYCWGGQPFNGRSLGAGSTLGSAIPVAVLGGHRFSSISAGHLHGCGLTMPNGAAVCWGENANGVLGTGGTDDQLVPEAVVGGRTFAALRTGGRVTCGIATAGIQSFCWGRHWPWAEIPRTIDPLKPDFVNVPVLDSIVAGWRHACGITRDPTLPAGAVFCWGDNNRGGRLGAGSTPTPPAEMCTPDDAEVINTYGSNPHPCHRVPVRVAGTVSFRALSAAALHTCGIAADGSAWCWGDNRLGQLGDGTTTSRNLPTRVTGTARYVAIDAAGGIQDDDLTMTSHTCAIDDAGQAWCWGDNRSGQLGSSAALGAPCSGATCSRVPVSVGPPAGATAALMFRSIAAGANNPPMGNGVGFTCAVTQAGALYCWGGNANGRLGNPSATGGSPVPVRVREPLP